MESTMDRNPQWDSLASIETSDLIESDMQKLMRHIGYRNARTAFSMEGGEKKLWEADVYE